MMKLLQKLNISILLICILVLVNIHCVEEEDQVLVLNDNNFEEEIKNHNSILVEFYAPWCGHCQSIAPEYAKAASILRDLTPPFYLAKIDAAENKVISEKFKIYSFPTLKLLRDSEWIEYDGGRTAQEIVNWVKKKHSPPSTLVKTVEEIEKEKSNEVIVIFFGEENSEQFSIFSKMSRNFEDVLFFHVTDSNLFSHYEVRPNQILLFKQFDEGKQKFTGELTEEALTFFLNFYSIPLISKFDERSTEAVFGRNKIGLFFIRSEANPEQKKLDEIFTKVARDYRGKIIFVISDIVGELEEKLVEYYGISQADLPYLRITDVKGEEDIKDYIISEPITEESMRRFLDDFLEGKLQVYEKSEEVPTEQNEPVYKIVGKTFKEVTMDYHKNVLVEFYAPWCGHCQELEPIYAKLAEHYKDDKSILIAKIDATANDTGNIRVDGYPTIKLFLARDKSDVKDFEGTKDLESLIKFVDDMVYPKFNLGDIMSGNASNASNAANATNAEASENAKIDL